MNKRFVRSLPESMRPVAKVFSALGDEYRQRLVLMFEKGERLNLSQIVEVSSISRTAVSHHLRVLREAGIVLSEKKGKEVFYWINPQPVRDAFSAVLTYIDRRL